MWNAHSQTYTFSGTKNDAKLWWCYFREDTKFFQTFLKKEEITIPFEDITYVSFVPTQNSTSEQPRPIYSSEEAYRQYSDMNTKRILPPNFRNPNLLKHIFNATAEVQRAESITLKKNELNKVTLGYLQFDTTKSFQLPLLKGNLLDVSLVETRNNKTVISILPSTAEVQRKNTRPDPYLKSVYLKQVTKDFDPLKEVFFGRAGNQSKQLISDPIDVFEIVLEIDGNVPTGKEYQVAINPNYFSHYSDNINAQPAEKIYSHIIKTYTPNELLDSCTDEYKPVCAYIQSTAEKRTFSNRCELEKARAKFFHNGECKGSAEELSITLNESKTPKSAIAIAGDEISVAVYTFETTSQEMRIKDLAINVEDSSLSSVKEIRLYDFETGTFLGSNYTANVANGIAYFKGVNHSIGKNSSQDLEIRAVMANIDDNDSLATGISGSKIKVGLTFGEGQTEIINETTGTIWRGTYSINNSNEFILMNNKVFATEIALSSPTVSVGEKEILKFKLDVEGDNEAYLTQLFPDISALNVTVEDIALFESGKLLASKKISELPDNTLTIGNCSGSFGSVCDSSTNTKNANGDNVVIIKPGATYVLKAKLAATEGQDIELASLITTLSVNSREDGIEWQDYGKSGVNGNTVADQGFTTRWIDLGQSRITQISGTLSN